MNRLLSARRAVALMAVLALAGASQGKEETPFQGRFAGDVTHTSVDAQTDFVIVDALGNATHLGKFTVTVPHFVNTPTRTAAGHYEFTAANGDKLTAEFTGIAAPTATPGVISIIETATITGGTGRFAGATGHFVVERLFDRIANTTAGTFEGTISCDHRKK